MKETFKNIQQTRRCGKISLKLGSVDESERIPVILLEDTETTPTALDQLNATTNTKL